jgi:signal peptidase I
MKNEYMTLFSIKFLNTQTQKIRFSKFVNIFLLLLIFSFTISSINAYATTGMLTLENRTLGTATPIENIKDLPYKMRLGFAIFGLDGISTLMNTSNILKVNSDTMAPALNNSDIILVSNNTSFDSLNIGDIIVFFRPSNDGSIIVSRVIDMRDISGELIVVTKGDSNEKIIPLTDYPIRERDYIGTIKYAIPQ